MERLAPEAPLPPEMQGRWVAEIEPEYEMIVQGGDIFMGGGLHEYVERIEFMEGEAKMIEFKSRDEDDPSHIYTSLNLALTPDQELSAFSDDLGMVFVRPET